MQLMNEIPDTFWSLFRSVNRDIYIEALLCINEEYEYNNYFLTKECTFVPNIGRTIPEQHSLRWRKKRA